MVELILPKRGNITSRGAYEIGCVRMGFEHARVSCPERSDKYVLFGLVEDMTSDGQSVIGINRAIDRHQSCTMLLY